ncbi:hypothetical protein WG899_05465 [Paucibacter sp. AS339]|uniref:hypothetical protein n=1 Tax=Paucibacter hankyongi TaxID=3133434 RepID=UPI0030ABB4C8
MNDQMNDKDGVDQHNSSGGKVDQGRRRLGTVGVTGTAVLLSVPSRSAVAGWGSCTGSELASGNLSRAGAANPCGCSPGFWGPQNQNGTNLWAKTPKLFTKYPPTTKFNSLFGAFFGDQKDSAGKILVKGDDIALNEVFPGQRAGPGSKYPNKCSASDSTAMHAVAALLNAEFYGARYPVAPPYMDGLAVIADFKSRYLPKTFASFVTKVDVYSSSNTWCNGKDHGGIV